MGEREKTCCFSGHRPERLPWGTMEGTPGCAALKTRLLATRKMPLKTRLLTTRRMPLKTRLLATRRMPLKTRPMTTRRMPLTMCRNPADRRPQMLRGIWISTSPWI